MQSDDKSSHGPLGQYTMRFKISYGILNPGSIFQGFKIPYATSTFTIGLSCSNFCLIITNV